MVNRHILTNGGDLYIFEEFYDMRSKTLDTYIRADPKIMYHHIYNQGGGVGVSQDSMSRSSGERLWNDLLDRGYIRYFKKRFFSYSEKRLANKLIKMYWGHLNQTHAQ